jgi:hypothetical protein
MITSSDTEAGPVVIYDCPDAGLQSKRGPEGSNAAREGNTDDEEDL